MSIKSLVVASVVLAAGIGLSGCVSGGGVYVGSSPGYYHSHSRPHYRPPHRARCHYRTVKRWHNGHVVNRRVRVCRR